jgi:DNA ligase 1
MSAGKFEEKYVKFPVYVSPKLDGVRCLAIDGNPMSKSMKIIPSNYLQHYFSHFSLHGLDGEIIVGNPVDKDCCRKTVSYVMSHDKIYDFTYYVFDLWNSKETFSETFSERFNQLKAGNLPDNTVLVETLLVNSFEELYAYETKCLEEGHEGIMIRSPNSLYKNGRSSSREAYLLKLKRWEDAEGEIIGYEEKMHNANESSLSELGYKERSSFKDGMVPTNTLGAYKIRILNGPFKGKIGNVGSGFKGDERVNLWQTKEEDLGKIITFKYFAVGVKDLPRFMVYLRFREKIDMEINDDSE